MRQIMRRGRTGRGVVEVRVGVKRRTFRYADYARYFHRLRARLSAHVASPPADSYPDPCPKCDQCRWSDLCAARRLQDDHLWQVAGIFAASDAPGRQ